MTRLKRRRFSTRSLLVFVTLICIYFGCWEITKEHGIRRQRLPSVSGRSALEQMCPAPFLVRRVEIGKHDYVSAKICYYLSIFGIEIRVSESKKRPYVPLLLDIRRELRNSKTESSDHFTTGSYKNKAMTPQESTESQAGSGNEPE